MTIRGLAFPFALAVLPAATATGQSRQIPAAAQSSPVIITSATVHTVTGPTIDDGYVVFDNGLILEVGQGCPRGVRRPWRHMDGQSRVPNEYQASTEGQYQELGSHRRVRMARALADALVPTAQKDHHHQG